MVMNLYEVTNSFFGCSYVRCYVWANDQSEALKLAREAYKRDGANYRPNYWKKLECKFLFSEDAESFATVPSDNGWEVS